MGEGLDEIEGFKVRLNRGVDLIGHGEAIREENI